MKEVHTRKHNSSWWTSYTLTFPRWQMSKMKIKLSLIVYTSDNCHITLNYYQFNMSCLFVSLNEWMCIYIPHISHTVSRWFTILIEWDRTSACKGASGCRYQSIFDLTHPPSPCMKCTMKQQIDHHTGNYAPYSFRQVCGFFNVPCWPCNTEDAGDGAYGL